MKLWSVEQAAWAAQRRQIEGDRKTGVNDKREALQALGPEPQRPLAPFLIAGDLTLEGLTKAWPSSNASLGIFTAEGGLFTGGHGMSDENRLRTAAALSQLWDGETVKRIRPQDGEQIFGISARLTRLTPRFSTPEPDRTGLRFELERVCVWPIGAEPPREAQPR